MSQNPTDLRLEDLPDLNAHSINKAKKEGTVLLTVVFWDITGFSNLCNILDTDSRSLVLFLKVEAALKLRERFKVLQTKWIDIWEKHIPHKITIGLKCGINTGYTIVSNIGTKKRAQFTALGTTVNIASRLADICNSQQIIVSTTTKSKISNQFELKSLGTLTDLKNIHGQFEIFTVLRKKI